MASTRAQEVAEVLWELKRAGKVATFSAIAQRAGFSAGAQGRTMKACLKTVRRDWPHLQWWRAINDDKTIKRDSEQQRELEELGVGVGEEVKDGCVAVEIDEELLMDWNAESGDGTTADEAAETA